MAGISRMARSFTIRPRWITPRRAATARRQAAVGSQVSGIFQFGDYTIYQPLAGPDGVVGNDDDPVLMPQATYALTIAIGQRLAGNQFGVTYGGYDIQLLAGTFFTGTIIGRETDAVTPAPERLSIEPLLWIVPLWSQVFMGSLWRSCCGKQLSVRPRIQTLTTPGWKW